MKPYFILLALFCTLFVTAQEIKQIDWKNRYSLYTSLGLGNVFSDYNYGKAATFPAQ